jgi:hypothetical protein
LPFDFAQDYCVTSQPNTTTCGGIDIDYMHLRHEEVRGQKEVEIQ